jgi:hypothetical protein
MHHEVMYIFYYWGNLGKVLSASVVYLQPKRKQKRSTKIKRDQDLCRFMKQTVEKAAHTQEELPI